jgi:cell division protein FtsQ
MPVPVPADKRFRRAHVHPARRRAWMPRWQKLVPLLIGSVVAAYVVYRATVLVLAADVLTISRITVDGTNRMSPGEVLTVVDGLRGSSMVTADLEAWRQKLLDSPWVADAAMRRVFPRTVSIVIKERDPLALARIGDALYLIDGRGSIIDEFGPAYSEFDLPIVDGLAGAPAESGTLIDAPRAALAARLLMDLQRRPDLARRISQIDVSDARDAVVILKGDTAMIRVGGEQFAERVQGYLDLAARLRDQVPQIDYVDMRFDERVYVRPQAARPRRVSGP